MNRSFGDLGTSSFPTQNKAVQMLKLQSPVAKSLPQGSAATLTIQGVSMAQLRREARGRYSSVSVT
ncbi:hypothetical protein [Thioclava indica]|nr:hypothetical protein [Thioclava indica]